MSLIETICCQDGQLQALPYHQARIRRSRAALFGDAGPLPLNELSVPAHARSGRFKCRLTYGREIEQVAFEPYAIRPVHSLLALPADGLDYAFKYAERGAIQALYEQRGTADDILMIQNGLLTDTSYANVALWDGAHWFTPAVPLLLGTRRAQLLAQGRLRLADIRLADLPRFRKIALFNAMMDLGEGPVLGVEEVCC